MSIDALAGNASLFPPFRVYKLRHDSGGVGYGKEEESGGKFRSNFDTCNEGGGGGGNGTFPSHQ